ncbi:papain family cysteine protease [Necator americanus]|uniref:Papain family cysteine protease n=1 Tax=Necator americanus TaxID=51031 RepID=W2TCY7_NECAM|nr:papain family cysteine protease [Necator americanus]ETN78862.1 papain family cysteine protease [Necator americanus]
MITIITLLLIASTVKSLTVEEYLARPVPEYATKLTGQAYVDYVNQHQSFYKVTKDLLQAEYSPLVEQYAKAVMRSEFMTKPNQNYVVKDVDLNINLPETFDAREKWPNCTSIRTIRDQSNCGSCWAVSAASVMSDRLCIQSNGTIQSWASDTDILSCCWNCGMGCDGGRPFAAFFFAIDNGVCTGGPFREPNVCKPYAFYPCGRHQNQKYFGPCPKELWPTPKCRKMCQLKYNVAYKDDKIYGNDAYSLPNNETRIMQEIFTNGPVVGSFSVFADFAIYKKGVYVSNGIQQNGAHAVKIIGWGVQDGLKYWLIANSWNNDWGDEEEYLAQPVPEYATKLTGQAYVDYINQHQSFYRAEYSPLAEQYAKTVMSSEFVTKPNQNYVVKDVDLNINLPETFDAREKWPNCTSIRTIRDQSKCGSCWAVSSASVMSDRLCIQSNSTIQARNISDSWVSATDILSCCKNCGRGCYGGSAFSAFVFAQTEGVCTGGPYREPVGLYQSLYKHINFNEHEMTEPCDLIFFSKNVCKPYAFYPCGPHRNQNNFGPCPEGKWPTPKCRRMCQLKYNMIYEDDKIYGKATYHIPNTETQIMQEIFTNGPVVGSFSVYGDFEHYKEGVYVSNGVQPKGIHSVKIIGWGVHNGLKYWLIANSWNIDWGDEGYVRFLRGVNHCGIETSIVTGLMRVRNNN